MRRYDLIDLEWRVTEALLPNKSKGVPRVNDESTA
jgi:transposase